MAPVKLPSEPPPELCDADVETERAGDGVRRSYSAIARPSGSQTGRVTPRVTLNCTSFDEAPSASIRATPRSRSSCRLAISAPRRCRWWRRS